MAKSAALGEVIITESITNIAPQTFYNCANHSSITIGRSISIMGTWAFMGCYKPVEVVNKSTSILRQTVSRE